MPFETGSCRYTVKYLLSTRTSGDERLGPEVVVDYFESEGDAARHLALMDGLFTKNEYGWRGNGGYTTANISRIVEYELT